jgi:hypothetical protein
MRFIGILGVLLINLVCAEEGDSQPLPGTNGWSIDLGGDYTWENFTISPNPSYSGNTGGVIGRITYQAPWDFFGQARTVYNLGPLSSKGDGSSSFHEWYMELVGGWCFPLLYDWSFTPYVGLGIDYLHNHLDAGPTNAALKLNYQSYYAIAGFDTHYAWKNIMVGFQFDCFPIFTQGVETSSIDALWLTSSRVGFDGRLPISFRVPSNQWTRDIWLEISPYYRFMPIGHASAIGLSHRNLDEWGAFITLRFMISKQRMK